MTCLSPYLTHLLRNNSSRNMLVNVYAHAAHYIYILELSFLRLVRSAYVLPLLFLNR